MALYDGFFDAVVDESTGEYDRAYGPGDFTGYFSNVIGSGVCIHNNPDSFKAEYEDGTLYLRPGYLFIQGYWLANKAGEGEADYKGYAVTPPANMTGSMAVVAHLNLGQRLIEIEVRAVSQAYPDALVLAIITASTAEDTRHNTDVCGVIDTAGELSSKVEWALNYIDTEIESKLVQVEADIAAQELKLDAKIAEVQAVADSIVPPPVGSIKFSASQDVGPEWLQCNGDFISESQYPELVAALGKLTPSGDKFQLISSGEIGPQISNGVLYGGRLWVYSYSTGKLCGVDVEGTAAVKEVTVTSESEYFGNFSAPSTAYPICLSIVPHKSGGGAKLFLSQIVGGSIYAENENYAWMKSFLLFASEFTGEEQSISLVPPFSSVTFPSNYSSDSISSLNDKCMPYIVSKLDSAVEVYYCSLFYENSYIRWITFDFSGEALLSSTRIPWSNASKFDAANNQRVAFSQKNLEEIVTISSTQSSSTTSQVNYSVQSQVVGMFSFSGSASVFGISRGTPGPLNVIGLNKLLVAFDLHGLWWASISNSSIQYIDPQISLPSAARVFVDGAAYLWGKDIYLIFVGTGIIFSRTLEEGSFGYLDTTSVLGTITQFGYLDYSRDEGTLYLLGQDTTNTVKVAKIVLNTLYDYANDGAWLPMIASDGVPAYIKAKEAEQ